MAVVTGSCADGQKNGTASPSGESSQPLSRSVEPSTSSTIFGIVTLSGFAPAMQRIDMSDEPNCMNKTPVFQQTIVTGANGALANAVVYVKSGLENYRFDSPSNRVVLDQKGCMYEPHIIALMVNQPLQINNDDMTIHNVHPISKINDSWNRSQPPGAESLVQSFPRAELAIPIVCNVHPWMRSYTFVFAHPYYTVTSKSGMFDLKGLPPGRYTIEAWHEKYGTQDQIVTVGPKESKNISLVFKVS
jgi:hypothetical protein